MPTLKTATLGCKVNQYETEYVRGALAGLGYGPAAAGQAADLCIVNTCTVTAEADLKSRKIIRRLARENPRAAIIVMGCYATRARQEVAALPGVSQVLTDKRRLPDLLAGMGLVDVPSGISSFGRRQRAYVKVQDGCRMNCAYCIIPKVRPRPTSRPLRDVLEEVRRLADNGHREIVLVGIHLGHYGLDLAASGAARVNLAGLVQRIVELEGEFRVRISSLEAAEVNDALIGVAADHHLRVCPHLHLSLQSGSDAVLERMGRRYSCRQFVQKCQLIRRRLDRPALTTDVIVGFPGETEADFRSTCRVVEEVGFSKVHVFRFSPRQGTPAAEMPDQVRLPIRRRRSAELSELARKLRTRYFQSLSGRQLQVLVESRLEGRPGMLLGTSGRYAPVELPGGEDRIGQLVQVTAATVGNGRIQAANSRQAVSS